MDYVKDIALEELTRVYCIDLLAESREVTLSEDELSKVSEAAEAYYDSLSDEEISYMGVSSMDIS